MGEEMRQQFDMDKVTDIFVTCGSGWNIKVHGGRVHGTNEIFQAILKKEIEDIGLDYDTYKDCVTSHDFMVGEGYGRTNPKINDIVMKSPAATGVCICTTYTGKSTATMMELMQNKPEVFNGKNVLFVHTGGVPGLFADYNISGMVEERQASTDGKLVTRVEDYLKA